MQEKIINARKLLEENPKAFKLIVEWFLVYVKNLQLEFAKGIEGAEIPEVKYEDVEATIAPQFALNPRSFFDAFDFYNIYIRIDNIENSKGEIKWFYNIRNKTTSELGEVVFYNTRQESEIAAFDEALKLLNDKEIL